MINEPISIVIPCYNESGTIADVLSSVRGKLNAEKLEHELIVVDDGSTDDSARVAEESGMADRVIRHRVNRGYGASLKDGIRAASHGFVLTMDADGQHTPENVLALLSEVDGHDMVVGVRAADTSPDWRRLGKSILKLLCEILLGKRIPDLNSGLRFFRREQIMKYAHMCSDQFSFSTSSTLAFMSDRLSVKFVPVDVKKREKGRSQVRLATGFSTFMLVLQIVGTFNPLRIFMPPTLLLFVVGIGLLIQGLCQSNVGDVAILCLISSAIFFCFGLLADQLALLRREINKS